MDKNFRLILTTLAAVQVVLVAGSRPASAQYVISARGGLVNYTTGPVTFSTSDDPTWREVPSHFQLNKGDRLKTEDWGKAELLLNPGAYLRIGNNAEVVVLNTELGATAVRLLSGSAFVEADLLEDGASVTVRTPFSQVLLEKDGLYRIDVASDAMTLTVRHGEAYFSRADGTLEKVKKNKTALVTAERSHTAKFDPDHQDEFDLWSADRAEMLLAANQSFIQRMSSWNWPTLRWSAWVYDPFFGCYTFFPWGSGFWSAYGFGYYYPWYSNGYQSGGYWGGVPTPYSRAASGSTRPGGTSPTWTTKPPFSVRTDVAKEKPVALGGAQDQPSGGFSIHKSPGSPGGPVRGGSHGGYSGSASPGSGAKGGGGFHTSVPSRPSGSSRPGGGIQKQ